MNRATALRTGVNGLLWTLKPGNTNGAAAASDTATASVTVNYAGFADAAGGGFGSRLRLVTLPACALTTPARARCQVQTPVTTTRNDVARQRLTGTVVLPATSSQADRSTTATARPQIVMAASAAPTGGGGMYTATSLSPQGSWSAGGSSGAFTYTYAISTPNSVGGNAPSVSLGYSSANVDGRTSTTNSQASWVGDGWDYTPGFVERSYKTCSDDGQADTVLDECWAGDNATLSLNGTSSRLIPTGTGSQWRLQGDDGSIVDEISVASTSSYFNGLNDGTYWRLTAQDGTQYFFGADHLPASAGGTGTDTSTAASWGVPVFGDDAGEPCHAATFDTSRCLQGWRWNLDFVVDPHQNLIVYSYSTETNNYMAGTSHTRVSYLRGGWLNTIEYGTRVPDYTANKTPADQILFGVVERCDGLNGFNCSTAMTSSNASHWPDVPFDQMCGASGTCTNYAPTFFTRKALSTITTQTWNASLATRAWDTLDTYTLSSPTFPDPGDAGQTGGKATGALWLGNIKHVGNDTRGGGAATAAVTTTFTGTALANRVDGLSDPNIPMINRFRINSITSESGSQIGVGYDTSQPCSRTSAPAEDNDHTRCFPARWTPVGYADPILDWFRIYPVVEVDVKDNGIWGANASPMRVVNYSYANPAWHRDDSNLTASNARTWGQFRGFATVTTTSGADSDPVTKSVTQYLQGMHGDRNLDGTTKSVTVTDASGDQLTDYNLLAGFAYQTTTYSRSGGTAQLVIVNRPWLSPATATQTFTGLPSQNAKFTNTDRTDTRALLADGTWRISRVTRTFDPTTGLTLQEDDLGEIDTNGNPVASTTTPERCITTSYATDTTRNMVNYPAMTIVNAGPCSSSTNSTTISASQVYYGGSTTLGVVTGGASATATQALKQAPATWTPKSTVKYDKWGRVVSATDAEGRKTDTSYTTTTVATTSTAQWLPDKITSTIYPLGSGDPTTWTSSSTLDIGRQLPVSTTDANGNTVSEAYDGIGRLIKVWLPNRPQTTNASSPSEKFSYKMSQTGFTSVTTSTLSEGGIYYNDITIYDGMLQPRQEQTVTTGGDPGKRLVSDTGYDSHGWVAYTDQPFYDDTSDPTSTPVFADPASIPSRTKTGYDGRGRPVTSEFWSGGAFQWQSSASYPGADEVDTTPADGGIPTAAISDARGQTIQVRQFHGNTPTGQYDVSYHAYDAAGRQIKTVGPIAAASDPDTTVLTWTQSYDALGDVIHTVDPDTGTTDYQYNDDQQLASSTQTPSTSSGPGTPIVIGYHYDALGRKDYTYNGTDQNNKIASWSYDPTNGNGLLAKEVSYAADGTTARFTHTIGGYTDTGKPTSETLTVPAQQYGNAAAITYTTSNSYTPIADELYQQRITDSGASSLLGSSETYSLTFNDTGQPLASGGAQAYETNTYYDPQGRVVRAVTGIMPSQLVLTNQWDAATGRLVNSTSNKEDGSAAVDNITYTYNQAGQITSATNREDGGATAAKVDQQCFSYDYLNRLTNAWTANDGTTPADPTTSDVGAVGTCAHASPSAPGFDQIQFTGPAPYYQTFGYGLAGNRTSQVDHAVPGGPGTDINTNYSYDDAGSTHALSSSTTGSSTTTYSYVGGNTTKIDTGDPATTQNLTWDNSGNLAAIITGPANAPSHTTTFDYDAGGTQIARTTDDSTTLQLGNDTLTIDNTGTTTQAVRTFTFPGGATVVRTATTSGSSVHFEAGDPQGTATTDIDASTLTITRRAFTPFGQDRSTAPASWPTDKGFVGGSIDTTDDITTLGTRNYAPSLGRFLSVDPLLEVSDPQAINGYTYADDNPVNMSDPSGLEPGSTCMSSHQTGCGEDQQLAGAQQCQSNCTAPAQHDDSSKNPPSDAPSAPSSPASGDSRGCSPDNADCADNYGSPTSWAEHEANKKFGGGCGNGYCVGNADWDSYYAQQQQRWYSTVAEQNPQALIHYLRWAQADAASRAGTLDFLSIVASAWGIGSIARLGIRVIIGKLAARVGSDLALDSSVSALEQGAVKVPSSWGEGIANSKGVGTRWVDPAAPKANGIRIDEGIPGSNWPSQQVDHVVIRSGGRILGPDGKPIVGSLRDNPQAHIPLSDWLQWSSWNAP